ncbi:hypothetical protein [Stutzerimonas stutzeri]|uniref:hypothetical protein n=1 Tax=Stutzerimonas stutzeri TaxID=316 RepID=UPI0021093851|nr:hypothetical protein [Stutzerimonas stutzeri]MCQ4257483.1 hypothetical protein [Stutzerimonas stutzeri]
MNKLDAEAYQARHGRRPYWLSLLIALDQLANALLWGYVDETLSSRAYRSAQLRIPAKRRWRLAERLINRLFWRDRLGELRHCQLAYLGELAREHSPSPPRTPPPPETPPRAGFVVFGLPVSGE